MTAEFAHTLERSISIRAPRDLVFRFFTDTPRWASWWGQGSTIEGRVGGRVVIRFPGGNEVVGEVVQLNRPEQITFTYGYTSGAPIAPSASRVTIRLEPVAEGTRVHLLHEFADAAAMQLHVQGWRYQLSLFGNVVADEAHAQSSQTVDAWFAMWSNPEADERRQQFDRLAAPNISIRDRFSAIDGANDVRAHIDAVHTFMPGFVLRRDGSVRHCQGQLLADWKSEGADGNARAAGVNVFTLTGDGRIESVVGFWSA